VLKVVLIALAAFGLGGALLHWTSWGQGFFEALMFVPSRVVHRYEAWRLVTSGLLTGSFSQLLFAGIGLYFLSPDLERRWGSQRFAAFLAASIVVGNLLVLAVDAAMPKTSDAIFHPEYVYGAMSAMTAIAVAWAQANPELEVRLFFFLPIKGKYLFWITVVWCVISLVYGEQTSDGVVAPFGGIVAGLAFAGGPSILRRTYLELKLAILKRRTGSAARPAARASVRKARAGGPALRVLPGGLEEELRKREPPSDKRYLN
jgi:membrane associated rhomboid family serine protease